MTEKGEVKQAKAREKQMKEQAEKKSGVQELAKEVTPSKEETKAAKEEKPSESIKAIAKEAKPSKEEKKSAKEVKKEEKAEKFEEKILTIPLRDAWNAPRTKRARAAVKILKAQLKRHIKREVKLDDSLNKALWTRGIQKPPRKIKVKVKVGEKTATAYPVMK